MAVSGSKQLRISGTTARKVIRALDSDVRLLILGILSHEVMNLTELTAALGIPLSTAGFHVKQLEAAGLLQVEYQPGSRGSQKLVSKRYDEILFDLPGAAIRASNDDNVVEISMPVGSYSQCEIHPTCGLASEASIIARLDDPRSFFEPDHVHAQILWFGSGYVEYQFPNNIPFGATIQQLELSMELCSEAPQYALDWPSDITLWVNDQEVGTWTSPGDLGGVRTPLMPDWWIEHQSTYGELKRWTVRTDQSYLDDQVVSARTIADLQLQGKHYIRVRIGIKPDAQNVGGINLYGRKFGNHAQDIVMRIHYQFEGDARPYRMQ
ncbi:ArsR/SmtB family transcription factor [Deinococcus sonorensis]|uniref:Helix-turn-helix domain-containing protein n=2 Tax=Deinococcus sonorensis TaxID=309891 RepID=A0AAU7UBP1_9DEIO